MLHQKKLSIYDKVYLIRNPYNDNKHVILNVIFLSITTHFLTHPDIPIHQDKS